MQKNKFIKDRKAISLLAQDIPVWFFRFLLLIVIITGIALTVYAFYSKNIDTREIEISIIAGKIANCIVKEGILQDVPLLSLEKCGLNLNLEENYINITLQDKSTFVGNTNLEVFCALEGIRMQYKPTCLWQKYYVLDMNKEGVYVDLLVASIRGLK